MKLIKTALIYLTRVLAQIRWLCYFIFKGLESLPIEAGQRSRLYSYVFLERDLDLLSTDLQFRDWSRLKAPKASRRLRAKRLRQAGIKQRRSFCQVIIDVGIAVLRGFNRIGLGGFADLILKVTASFGMSPIQVRSLYERVFDSDEGSRLESVSRTIIIGDIFVGKSRVRTNANLHKALSSYSTLNIFLEPGGELPNWLAEPAFTATDIVIYAFGDVSAEIRDFGLELRARQASLRDQFNDISDKGEALFQRSTTFSDQIIAALSEKLPFPAKADGQVSEGLKDAMQNGLDSLVSTKMSLLQCFARAIAAVEPGEGVLFCANSPQYILAGWPTLEALHPVENFAVTYSAPNLSIVEDFMVSLYDKARGRDVMNSTSAIPDIRPRWVDFLETARSGVVQFSKSITHRLEEGPTALLIHAESAKPYQQTLQVMAETFQGEAAAPFKNVVFLHAALTPEERVLPRFLRSWAKGRRGVVSTAFAIDLGELGILTRTYLRKSRDLGSFASGLLQESNEYVFDDANYVDFLAIPFEQFLRRRMPLIVMAHFLGERLNGGVDPIISFASTSRHWMSRAICSGFLEAGEQTENLNPLVDIQTMNILDHPKYKRPMASHLTVIDRSAKDIHVKGLGFPETAIELVGAPPNDLLSQRVEKVDQQAFRSQLGIADGKSVVTLISQLQPIERMLQIAQPLADLMKESDITVIIRLHPREDDGRAESYRALFSELGLEDRLILSLTETPEQILSISNVCVTIYSNMAREAALLGIPVMSIAYPDWTPPFSLSEQGLAQAAHSPSELVENIKTQLSLKARHVPQNAYLQANPHLADLAAGARILNYAIGLAGGPKALELPGRTKAPSIDLPVLKDATELHLVCGADVKLRSVPGIFPINKPLFISASDNSDFRGLIPAQASVSTGAYSAGEEAHTRAFVKSANKFTEEICSAIINWSKACGGVSDDIARLRYSVWLQMRPLAIRSFRSIMTTERGIARAGDVPLILHSNDSLVLRSLVEKALLVRKNGEPTYALRVNDDLSYDFIRAEDLLLEIPPLNVKSRLPKLTDKHAAHALSNLENWWAGQKKKPIETFSGKRLLVTTDWKLKTVPPTLLPVLKAQRALGTRVVLANIDDRIRNDIGTSIDAYFGTSGAIEVTSPSRISKLAATPAGRVLKRCAVHAQHELLSDSTMVDIDPELALLASRMADVFVRTRLVETLLWDRYCSAFCRQGQVASVACPGRQWHAQTAHDAAESAARMSMTIQNSYMTGGYTYTQPTGRYLTAIDAWSRDLLVSSFGLPEEQVHVTSSPRFDYLAELKTMNPIKARAEAGFVKKDIVILYALQEGFEADAKVIIKALAPLTKIGDRSVKIIAKLHPRTPTENIAMYRSIAEKAHKSHLVEVVSDTRISTYLAACDVAITLFSNVGTEAAVLRKNLIIANVSGDPIPLPMDEFDIGHVVTRADDLVPSIVRFFEDEDFQAAHAARLDRFEANNPHMVEGTSTATLNAVLEASFDVGT